MENSRAICLVRVRDDDGRHRLYAVASDRKAALDRVLRVVPEGWAAFLLHEQLSAETLAALNLRPGEVREISQ